MLDLFTILAFLRVFYKILPFLAYAQLIMFTLLQFELIIRMKKYAKNSDLL